MDKPFEIVVLSGKGGTGKTSITAAFALLAENSVITDCDVDAADLHLILSPEVYRSENFSSGAKAVIDSGKCKGCGLCLELCRFGAIKFRDNVYYTDEYACEGCGLCAEACPAGAVTEPSQSGWHDLQRLIEMVGRFKTPVVVIINKYDLNKDMTMTIEKKLKDKGIQVSWKIPYDETMILALLEGKTINEFKPEGTVAYELNRIWETIKTTVYEPKSI